MAKKQNKPPVANAARPVFARPVRPAQVQKIPDPAAATTISSILQRPLLLAAVVALVTFVVLYPCLSNLLTNWDDPGYITNDPLIKNLSGQGISNIFSLSAGAVMGNYHPLTILSYAIEYSFVRLDPALYHLDNLLLHLLCTVLVFWLVQLLTRRPVAAFVAALLFGIHPMHVESVAWVAGRKDVLYGAFYLGSCIRYIYAARAAGGKRYAYYSTTILFFVLSLLSKPVAVSLPFALILIDYWEVNFQSAGTTVVVSLRPVFRQLLNKVPFFILALLAGLKSISDQHKFGALNTYDVQFNPIQRLALGCYALFTYLWKLVAPLGLSCFFPYPVKEADHLAAGYYCCILAIAVFILLLVYLRRNKVVVFGALFFLFNIILLLQFIPVGGAIIAERYTYIPYIGFFFIAGWYVSQIVSSAKFAQWRTPVLLLATVYCCWLGYLGNIQSKVWHDTTTLWTNEIEEHPMVPNAWNNLGFYYFNKYTDETTPAQKKIYFDSSYNLLNEASRLQPQFINPYISLGELERTAGMFAEGKRNYYKALSLKPDEQDANAYLGLAIIYAITHNLDSSGICFREALGRKPYFPEAHSNYGNYLDMTGKHDLSIQQYDIAIAQDPDMFAPHLNKGRELQRMKRYPEALSELQTAAELSPANGEVDIALSLYYNETNNKRAALQFADKAIALGYRDFDPRYYQMLKQAN